jgi:hypothetical protein
MTVSLTCFTTPSDTAQQYSVSSGYRVCKPTDSGGNKTHRGI